jgi:hypothetical protein
LSFGIIRARTLKKDEKKEKIQKPSTFFWKKESGAKKTFELSCLRIRAYVTILITLDPVLL